MRRFDYLRALLSFAFRENRLLWVCLGVALLSVTLELAAMSSLLPLANLAAGQPAPSNALVVRLTRAVGLRADGHTLLLVFVGLFALRIITQLGSQALTLLLSRRLLAQLATRAFARLVGAIPLKEMEHTSIGAHITLVGDECSRASNLVTYLNQLVALTLLATLYYAAVFVYSPAVAVGVAAFLVVSFLALFESFRASHRLGVRQVQQSQSASSLFLDALNGLRSVRAFSAETYVAGEYRTQMWRYVRTLFSIDAVSLVTRLAPVLLLLLAVAVLATLSFVREKVSLELPFIVTIVIFLMRFFPVAGQALNTGLRVIADARAGRDVTRLIHDDRSEDARGAAVQREAGPIECIEASEVRFSHQPGKLVLQGFSLALERGRSYALVGPSGSGKSTFLDLLLGLYPVESGRLLINGVPIESVSLSELRRRVLLVSQETTIFNDTVANNLRFGADIQDEGLRRACRIACIDEFITGMPDSYDTLLRYRGSNLSGGQKQRLGIARALARRPDALLLDECTSALDAETRTRVVDNLLDEYRDRVILFVSHDPFIMSRVTQVLDMARLNQVCLALPSTREPAGQEL